MPLFIKGKAETVHFNQNIQHHNLHTEQNQTNNPPETQIEGILKLSYDTYVTTGLHLIIKQPTQTNEEEQGAIKTHWRYLNQKRRMKTNKLNYFDHPMLGVLMKITPLS